MIPSKVTLCVPTYNRRSELARCLKSVLSQTFRELRVIVVDNASTDGTDQVVHSINDPRLSYVRNPSNLGMTGNWNRCLELALESRSPFIALYFDDDWFAPTLVEREVRFLENHPDVGFVHTAMHYLNMEEGRYKLVIPYPTDRTLSAQEMLDDLCLKRLYHISTPSVLMRREAVLKAGRFDPSFQICPDLDFWWRILDHYRLGYISEPLLVQTIHKGQMSSSFEALEKAITQKESLEAVLRALGRMRERYHSWDILQYQQQVRRFFAGEILKVGRSALLTPHVEIVDRACREALRLSPTFSIFIRVALLRLLDHPPGRQSIRWLASLRRRFRRTTVPLPGFNGASRSKEGKEAA